VLLTYLLSQMADLEFATSSSTHFDSRWHLQHANTPTRCQSKTENLQDRRHIPAAPVTCRRRAVLIRRPGSKL